MSEFIIHNSLQHTLAANLPSLVDSTLFWQN